MLLCTRNLKKKKGGGGREPLVKDVVGRGTWASLELRFNGPRKLGPLVLFKDQIDTQRVNVLSIEKQAVHVEKTGTNRREAASTSTGILVG